MDRLKNILNDDEWKPKLNNKKWRQRNYYKSFPNIKKIYYEIDKDLIHLMKNFNKIYLKMRNKEGIYTNSLEDKKIKRIYKVYDKRNSDNFLIAETQGSVFRVLKISLHRYLLGESDNYFDKLDVRPENAVFELIEYVFGSERKLDNKIKNYIYNLHKNLN
jgi:hypothetical protein